MIKRLQSPNERRNRLTRCCGGFTFLALCLTLPLASCRTTAKSEGLDDRPNSSFVGEEGATCDPNRGITCRRDLECKGADAGQAGHCSK